MRLPTGYYPPGVLPPGDPHSEALPAGSGSNGNTGDGKGSLPSPSKRANASTVSAGASGVDSPLLSPCSDLLQTASASYQLELERFQMLGSLMREAMILVDTRGHVIRSNSKVKDLIGLTAEELIYGSGIHYHVTDTAGRRLPRETMPLWKALNGKSSQNEEFVIHKPEAEFTINVSACPVHDENGVVTGALVTFEDISRQARAERRNELFYELSDLLNEDTPAALVFQRIAQLVGDVMGAWSVLALAHPGEDALEFVGYHHPDPDCALLLEKASQELAVLQSDDPGMGFVARTGRSLFRPHLNDLARLQGLNPSILELFQRFDSRSLVIVPMIAREQKLGAMMLVSLPHRRRFTEEDLDFAEKLVDRIAVKLDNARLVQDLRHQEWRLRLVAQLSRQFANSLELEEVLNTITRHIAEALGDWCVLGMLDERRTSLRIVSAQHRDTSKQELLDQLILQEEKGLPDSLAARVVEEGVAILHSESEDEGGSSLTNAVPSLHLHGHAQNATPHSLKSKLPQLGALLAQYQRQLAPFHPTSYLCVPLMMGDVALGFLELACSEESGRELLPSHLELLQELSTRATPAIQNAQLFQELQALNSAKDDWLSVASHELKTPLTPLQLNLQLMQRRLKRGEAITPELIERSLTQVKVLIRLIDDLLEVSKRELGQLKLHPEKIELVPLVERVRLKLAETTRIHALTLTYSLPPDMNELWVETDPQQLQQVLEHVVQNAIKYSPEGGPIQIAIYPQHIHHEPYAVIRVEDHGVGIPEDEQHRLFQRYFRASNVSERNYGGLGLGLWVSHELITRMKGKIWGTSTEGGGSQFYVALPLLTHLSALPEPSPT